MAAFARGILGSISCLILLTVAHAIPDQHTGLLASLYKKAAQENRPLVLVLDKSLKVNPFGAQPQSFTRKPHYSVKKQTPSLSGYSGKKLNYLLLQQLNKVRDNVQKPQQSKSPIDSILYERRLPKVRLPFEIDRDDRANYDPNEYHSLRILIKKNNDKAGRSRPTVDTRVLMNSIALNVLRQPNNKCGVNQDCNEDQDSCHIEIDCEEEKEEEERSSNECRFSESCAVEEKQISTKGAVEPY